MKIKKNFYLIFLSLTLFLSSAFFQHIFANEIRIKDDGRILLISENVKGKKLSILNFPEPGNQTGKGILGASTGVTITIDVSQFIPTDTPIPSSTPIPSNTPVPTQTPTPTSAPGAPTSTPAPTNTPTPIPVPTNTPAPSDNLIATIDNGTTTTSEPVTQIIQEDANGNPLLTITQATGSAEMTIQQGDTSATTTLPIKLNSDTKQIQVVTQTGTHPIIAPKDAIESVKASGSFIIPSSIKTDLVQEKGQPVYKVTGQEKIQIFGFLTIKLPLTIKINATTGKVLGISESIITTVLTFLGIAKRVIQ